MIPMDVYSDLVRLFYCNLEIGNPDNFEFTIESRVYENIIQNPSILSEIIGVPMIWDHIFIKKPSQLDSFIPYDMIVIDEISERGNIGTLNTHDFNVIPKRGHNNQFSTMDSFIIFRITIRQPLNLRYLILKEMVDMKNHKSKSLPYVALLTKVFKCFRVHLQNQHNQYIEGNFTNHIISHDISLDSMDNEGSEEGDEAHSRKLAIDVDVSPHTEEIPFEPQEQYVPPQDGLPAWFIEYFECLKATIECIEQREELHEKYIDRLGDNYEHQYRTNVISPTIPRLVNIVLNPKTCALSYFIFISSSSSIILEVSTHFDNATKGEKEK